LGIAVFPTVAEAHGGCSDPASIFLGAIVLGGPALIGSLTYLVLRRIRRGRRGSYGLTLLGSFIVGLLSLGAGVLLSPLVSPPPPAENPYPSGLALTLFYGLFLLGMVGGAVVGYRLSTQRPS